MDKAVKAVLDTIDWDNVADIQEEVSKFVFTSKYARYREDLKRRETWEEAVERVESMHLRRFSELPSEHIEGIRGAFDYVREKKAGPSMRSMQFGGLAVEKSNARLYNCSVRHVDSIRSFAEIFYMLLNGSGVGIGLSKKYLDRMPDMIDEERRQGVIQTYVVEDTIEGWADSLEALLSAYFVNTPYSGRTVIFDYSRIRAEGEPLKTSGGKAPGYKGLKAAHQKIKHLLDALVEVKRYKRMRSIDAYDILMHTADAVLSGGVRRSATSVVFQKDDREMINAKTGDWFMENPQRARSNNSVILDRKTTTLDEFLDIYNRTKEWGEPGFVWADNAEDTLYNPCFEVSFMPITDAGVAGVQVCNLSTVNGAKVESEQDFYDAVEAATIIGTLQASYTSFPYLSKTAEDLTSEEALLGVSITGMFESPDIILDPDIQQRATRLAVDTNRKWAEILGINQAARVTVLKPEGTSSLVFGTMASGIHPAHAPYMFRRVQMNKLDNVYRHFHAYNPHLCEPSVWSANKTDDVVTFPVKVKDGAKFKGDVSALEHLEIIKSTQQNYILPGITEANKKPISHNVSSTVVVKDEEWDEVASYIYDNKEYFTAVSLLGASGDKDYAQAPNEAVSTVEDAERFKDLISNVIPVDYSWMEEEDDNTAHQNEAACVGPETCEVVAI